MKKRKPVLRILIVEDDPDRARRLQSWLPQDTRSVVVVQVLAGPWVCSIGIAEAYTLVFCSIMICKSRLQPTRTVTYL
jgi:CheY-like chemotaxis protein